MSDAVNHPPHYNHSDIEPIDVIEAWGLGFNLGNCVKYISRCDHKAKPIEDLEKARWYLDREIQRRKAKADRTQQTSACRSQPAPAWQSFAGHNHAHG